MKIIGCDFHPSYQQIAMLDPGTGEMVEKALSHERKEEVRAFYAGLEGSARVGIEASGQSQWFERMLAELGHEVWICGEDPRQLRTETEDRPARCRVAAEASGRGSFSADLGAHGSGARRAAVAVASS
jgi:hypothetical protein